ncbi:MAG: 3-oxoacyl-ACP reductase FabG [Desulfovibrionaceae bacterium]|nr:3-oxoacyl-ACP reductase FabG [Desulfovibrionaceae bacterium]
MERYVLVTGAGRGIGRAIALALASAGHALLAHYHRSAEEARRLQEEVVSGGGRMELVGFDLANREEVAARLEACLEEYGPPWGVVCNAGICADNAFPALSAEDWDSVLRTNLDGFYNLLHPLVLPMCRVRRGRILALTSVAGITGNRGQVNYSASKAGIIGAAKALAVELASRSITVNCIAPGVIDTEMIRDAPLDKILPAIPLGRIGRPEEVAALAVFLLSEEAGYITRQVISVNGGMV